MRTQTRTIVLMGLFLLVIIGLMMGLTYWFGTMATVSDTVRILTPFAITPISTFQGTPITRYAGVDIAVVESLYEGVSPYDNPSLQVLSQVQSVGSYLPLTGNTQFQLIPPTPLPTPLPYPTTPPLPLPAIAGQPLPTLEGVVGRSLPYAGDGCAPSGNPVEGILTQRYHAYHLGIDIGIPLLTPVIATHSGTVVFTDWSTVGYGYLVIVQNATFITYYAHNTSFNVVAGQQVGKGSILAWSGSTGNSTGPHVHYEVRINDVPVDPLTFDQYGYATC